MDLPTGVAVDGRDEAAHWRERRSGYPELAARTGLYFNCVNEARENAQTYDAGARAFDLAGLADRS